MGKWPKFAIQGQTLDFSQIPANSSNPCKFCKMMMMIAQLFHQIPAFWDWVGIGWEGYPCPTQIKSLQNELSLRFKPLPNSK